MGVNWDYQDLESRLPFGNCDEKCDKNFQKKISLKNSGTRRTLFVIN
jgi:hypothetical protein